MLGNCSHCGCNGHNCRTCSDSKGGFKLFGVRVSADCCATSALGAAAPSECSSTSLTAMRKSVSMGNLCNYGSAEGGASPLSPSHFEQVDVGDPVEGYASDDLVHTNSSSRERKKGVPWVEEEHRAFLLGLQKLGKGDWRGISRNFVKTRTPTQVASHAQKYFLRRNNLNKRRRRSSLFDITADTQVSSLFEEPVLEETGFGDDPDTCPELSLGQSIPHGHPHGVDASQFARHGYPVEYLPMPRLQVPLMCPSTGVPYPTGMVGEAAKSRHIGAKDVFEHGHIRHASDDTDEMEAVPEAVNKKEGGLITNQSEFQLPHAPAPLWPGQGLYSLTNKYESGGTECKIVKPTPMIPRPPRKVEDAVKISKPPSNGRVMEPSPLSYRLLEEGSRHSAFHMTSASNGSSREVDGQSSLSNAINVTRDEIFSSVCDCMAA